MNLCAWYMVGAEPVLEKDENEAYEWAKKAAEHGMYNMELRMNLANHFRLTQS
jgi:TPR repeat protein